MYLSILKKRNEYQDFDEKFIYAKRLAENRRKYGDLSNEQNVHRMICDMAGGCKRKDQNLLYIKIGRDAKMFYIQSDCMLHEDIVRACGYNLIAVKDESSILQSIAEGSKVIIRAKLAPVERNSATRVQYSLATDEVKRAAWLNRLAERCGFRFINQPEEGLKDYITWSKKGQGNSWTNAFYYACEVEVTDKEQFVRAVETGVGKYKAYGCGMLMVG